MSDASRLATSKTIVIGIDGSEPSLNALRQSGAVAAALGATVIVVFVRHVPALAADPTTGQAIAIMGEALDELETEAHKAADEILGPLGITYSVVLRTGDPGHEIIEVAHEKQASLVVVGATIHGAVSSLVLGSVAQHLVHHCDVSLLIVRPSKGA